MALMKRLMQSFRESPPAAIGGLPVSAVSRLQRTDTPTPGRAIEPLDAPKSDMVILDLAEPGNYVAVRPSGTEPKVKFYFFSCLTPETTVKICPPPNHPSPNGSPVIVAIFKLTPSPSPLPETSLDTRHRHGMAIVYTVSIPWFMRFCLSSPLNRFSAR